MTAPDLYSIEETIQRLERFAGSSYTLTAGGMLEGDIQRLIRAYRAATAQQEAAG